MKLFKQKESYISEKVKLTGNIEADADIIIDGEMHGDIYSSKHVMLGTSSYFEGRIECDSAVIYGCFKGLITARRRIEVKVPATIVGDLVSNSVRVDSGVSLQGKILAKTNDGLVATDALRADAEPIAEQ